MNQESTKSKTLKHSQLKNAVISSIYDFILIITNIGFIILRQQHQKPFNIKTYNPLANILEIILLFISMVILIIILIYTVSVNSHTEKDDELSKLHRYRAGYISNYFTAALFAIIVFCIKDFSFAFTGDFIDALSLPIIILITSNFISHIIFIILEKFQLD